MTNAKKILIIGSIWPEPTSSAAGTRMIQLINFFRSDRYEITFASAALKSEFSFALSTLGVLEQPIKLNDQSFNAFVKELAPAIVMFDRFVIEEQYGWRVNQETPDAIKILDTEDLHFLRDARQTALTSTHLELFSDNAKREIASILRCDLSLIISEEEMKILIEQFGINKSILYYLPFLEEVIDQMQMDNWKSFEERADFIFIGNFLHEPNFNTVLTLKTKIWPILRKRLPKTKLHIYGAYPSQKVLQLQNPKESFYVLGRAAEAKATMGSYKVLLAPIQFGAGAKGKFIDAMLAGTPSMTTTIGAESMKGELDWNGFIEDDIEHFVDQSVRLYQQKELWLTAQQNGVQIINQRYSRTKFEDNFSNNLQNLFTDLKTHRQQNFIGQILHYQTNQSTKYMSLWIAEKNKKKTDFRMQESRDLES